jgi:hypothetical protein
LNDLLSELGNTSAPASASVKTSLGTLRMRPVGVAVGVVPGRVPTRSDAVISVTSLLRFLSVGVAGAPAGAYASRITSCSSSDAVMVNLS